MRSSFLAFCFGLVAVFSFANICEGTTSSGDVQETNGETLAYTSDVEVDSEEIASFVDEIENELEDAITDMIVENEENPAVGSMLVVGASTKSNLPLMFPSLTKTSKSQRKMNKAMAVKVASIVEEAVMLVANDILQTTVLLQIDPADFLQANTTTTTTTTTSE